LSVVLITPLLFPTPAVFERGPVADARAILASRVGDAWTAIGNVRSNTHFVLLPFAPFIIPLWVGSGADEPEQLTILERTNRVTTIEINPAVIGQEAHHR
jgi:hypothetical protein